MVSTIIAMNAAGTAASGPDIFGLFVDGGTGPSLGHNLIGDGTGGTGLTSGVNNDQVGGNGHPVIDPLFATTTPANNGGPTQTLALLSKSPALSKGSNPDSLPYDQRGPGYAHMTGGLTDIGAFQGGVTVVGRSPGAPRPGEGTTSNMFFDQQQLGGWLNSWLGLIGFLVGHFTTPGSPGEQIEKS